MAGERKKSWYSDDKDDDDDDMPSLRKNPVVAPKQSGLVGGGKDQEIVLSGDQNATLVEYMNKVEPLVQSINTLYNQFAAGVESRPPFEKIAQLEHVMKILDRLPKVTPGYRYRYQSVLSLYSSYKARWEKLLQDIEAGKITRFAAPKNRSGSGR